MTPTFDITFQNRSLFSTLQPYLLSLIITDEPGLKSDTCSLTLVNHRLELPKTGEMLKVSLGYQETGVYDMGTFEIDGYTLGPQELQLTAHAADFLQSMKNPKTRSFTDTNLAALVERLAQENGVQAAVAQELQNIRIPTLHQSSESDLHFLTRLGQKYNLLIKPAGGSLVARPLRRRVTNRYPSEKGVVNPDTPEVTITPDSVINWSYRLSKKEDIPSVTAKGYDPDSAEEFHETAGDAYSGDEALGYALRGLYPTREAARQAAQAAYEKLIQEIHTFSATVIGHPWIAAESRLVLSGFDSDIPQRWKISRATHSLTTSGYTTALEAMLDDEYEKQFNDLK